MWKLANQKPREKRRENVNLKSDKVAAADAVQMENVYIIAEKCYPLECHLL